MRALECSAETVAVLDAERFSHPHPEVRRQMLVVWLRTQGFDQVTCARIADVSERTVRRYLDQFCGSPPVVLETHSERHGASRRSRRKQPAASAVPLTEHDFQHEWRRASFAKADWSGCVRSAGSDRRDA